MAMETKSETPTERPVAGKLVGAGAFARHVLLVTSPTLAAQRKTGFRVKGGKRVKLKMVRHGRAWFIDPEEWYAHAARAAAAGAKGRIFRPVSGRIPIHGYQRQTPCEGYPEDVLRAVSEERIGSFAARRLNVLFCLVGGAKFTSELSEATEFNALLLRPQCRLLKRLGYVQCENVGTAIRWWLTDKGKAMAAKATGARPSDAPPGAP